jgi:hypothetical protein
LRWREKLKVSRVETRAKRMRDPSGHRRREADGS